MLTFKNFLKESLNKPYPSKFHDSDEDIGLDDVTHEYHFSDHNKRQHSVFFKHNREKPHEVDVSFSDPEGGFDATGDQRHHAVRVFATMKHVMTKHAKKHPNVKEFTFSSDKEEKGPSNYKEGSRNKLYRRLTSMSGGKTVDDNYTLIHKIPVNQDKKV